MDMENIGKEIHDEGLSAPRVTPEDIKANIVGEFYFTAEEGRAGALAKGSFFGSNMNPNVDALSLLTFCALVLRNDFVVTGESACVSPENFDAEIGRKIARQNAVEKVWPLMGYALRDKLVGS
jgi:hypothetical protein